MTLDGVTDVFIQGGAISVLVWVVLLLTSGKLHTSSEVEGLRQDKAELLAVNAHLSEALEQSNELIRLALARRENR